MCTGNQFFIFHLASCFVFFLNVLNLFLSPSSTLRKLIFSISWHDQFPSSFSKNKTYRCSILESFCQKTMSTPIWWMKPFPLQVALGHGVYPSNRKQRRAVIDVVPPFPCRYSLSDAFSVKETVFTPIPRHLWSTGKNLYFHPIGCVFTFLWICLCFLFLII